MNLKRPEWDVVSNLTDKLPLHDNVCRDTMLLRKTQDIIQDYDASEMYSYPSQYDLYKTVSDFHGVPIKNIAIGLGATEVINRLIFLLRNEKVVIVSPTFEMVKVYCEIYNTDFVESCYTDFNNFNVDTIKPDCIVYVASPNGNNGHSFNKDEIKHILKISKLVLLDESYIDYSSRASMLPVINDYDNLVIINTFSKSLGLAGIRCGYCFSNSEIIQQIQDIRMNHISTGLTNYLIQNLIHQIPETVKRMLEARNYLQDQFDSISSDGNYCILKDCEKMFDFCHYKSLGDNLIRVTLTNKDVFKQSLG